MDEPQCSTDDTAWVRLHVEAVCSGAARPQGRRYLASVYRRFAQEHPSLAYLALAEAERCEWEAARLEHGQAVPCALEEVGVGVDRDG
jgi:hypothetical protein